VKIYRCYRSLTTLQGNVPQAALLALPGFLHALKGLFPFIAGEKGRRMKARNLRARIACEQQERVIAGDDATAVCVENDNCLVE
jgi:hypothetical protein